MTETNKDLLEQFMRLDTLLRRYYMIQLHHRGPFGNPHRGQGRVLSILKLQPEISQKELLYLLDMSKQSLTELLNKLEKSGYITRTPSEADRRAFMVKLTEAGAAATEEAEENQPDMEKLFDALNDQEQEQFSGYVERLITELEKQLGDRGEGEAALFDHLRTRAQFFARHGGARPESGSGRCGHRSEFGPGGCGPVEHLRTHLHGRDGRPNPFETPINPASPGDAPDEEK
jgi:DNA-binding MarR family transcriptional regulator